MPVSDFHYTMHWSSPDLEGHTVEVFPPTENEEAKVRRDMQWLYNDLERYINSVLVPYLTTEEGDLDSLTETVTGLSSSKSDKTVTNKHFKAASYNASNHKITLTRENGTTVVLQIVPTVQGNVADTVTGKVYALSAEDGRLIMTEV